MSGPDGRSAERREGLNRPRQHSESDDRSAEGRGGLNRPRQHDESGGRNAEGQRRPRRAGGEPVLWLRIDLAGGRIGPGKVALLEAIAETGSIAAAGRRLEMSYRRAWELVADLNRLFGAPVVAAAAGGAQGGGAALTPLGAELVAGYRAIERAAGRAAAARLRRLVPAPGGSV